MPSPPNQTAGTARVITTLPYEIVEDVADQANTLELWYRYAGQTDDRMIGALPFADIAAAYEPKRERGAERRPRPALCDFEKIGRAGVRWHLD